MTKAKLSGWRELSASEVGIESHPHWRSQCFVQADLSEVRAAIAVCGDSPTLHSAAVTAADLGRLAMPYPLTLTPRFLSTPLSPFFAIQAATGLLFAGEIFAWFCVGEYVGRGFSLTGYNY